MRAVLVLVFLLSRGCDRIGRDRYGYRVAYMSEMREHTTLTLLNAWHWAQVHKAEAGGNYGAYPQYVVCYEAQAAIEAELKRRDRRAWSRWIHGGVLDSCNPDKYFMPEEVDHD